MRELPDAFDRYGGKNPYEVLGLSPDASAREICDRRNELQRNLQEAGAKTSDRAKEKERLENAYKRLCVPGTRMRIDFFLLDAQLGLKQCEAVAKTPAKPNTDAKGIIKPRQIRVTHAAPPTHL